MVYKNKSEISNIAGFVAKSVDIKSDNDFVEALILSGELIKQGSDDSMAISLLIMKNLEQYEQSQDDKDFAKKMAAKIDQLNA